MATTWNSADKSTHITLSAGDLGATGDGNKGVGWFGVRATTNKSSGKWYIEITATTIDTVPPAKLWFGGLTTGATNLEAAANPQPATGWTWYAEDGHIYNSSDLGLAATLAAGDIVGIAYDADANTIDFYKNGGSSLLQATSVTDGMYPTCFFQGASVATLNPNPSSPPSGFTAWDATTINVSDSPSLTENVSITQIYNISVNDALSVTESVTTSLQSFVSVNDTLTNTESVSSAGTEFVNVFDTLSIAENTGVEFFFPTSVFDTTTITESVTVHAISGVSVVDTVSLSEQVTTAGVIDPGVVVDTITVVEVVTTAGTCFASVFDTPTASESVTINLVLLPNVSDAISVSEDISGRTSVDMSVSDSLTITENVETNTLRFGPMDINKFPRGVGISGSGIISRPVLGYSI